MKTVLKEIIFFFKKKFSKIMLHDNRFDLRKIIIVIYLLNCKDSIGKIIVNDTHPNQLLASFYLLELVEVVSLLGQAYLL